MALLTEPVRKSVFDVVQYNLRATDCKTYITRVVYFGEYRGSREALQKRMEDIIQDLRVDYDDMLITGLLLVYPTHYIHVLEAWEDIIYKHYELVYATDGDECKFGKAIPLPSYHHVHQRFFSDWWHVYATPPTLMGTPEARTLDDVLKQVSNCLIKVYTLCECIANAMREKSIDAQDALRNLEDKAGRYLPERTVLEFLLNVSAPALKTVVEYLQMYSDASPNALWDDNNVWPPPCDVTPRDVFPATWPHREAPGYPDSEK
ncbi:hypothetical protein PUN28_003217 [Cardiocondyla obscurior]|uniref:Uncharacterized protein n=1 Tax=Cardiocondyla obscurior TaxID=286306 RepID=A0AAW2GHW7_9HYME